VADSYGHEPSYSIQGGKFLDQLNGYQLLKRGLLHGVNIPVHFVNTEHSVQVQNMMNHHL
jgi:hypothetical protein